MAALQLEVPPDVTAPVVVGCSGGADSLALLALAVDGGLAPIAVHVDHGLRAGSDREAGNVAHAAARLGAGFDARRVTVAPGPTSRLGRAMFGTTRSRRPVWSTARRRCSWPTPPTTRPRRSCSTCCGGAARPGWRACRPAAGAWCDRCSARWRADVRAECARRQLTPWEDPSNDDLAFRRNWIRHEVLPLLERGAGRDLTPLLTRQADVLRAESDFLDALAAVAWPGEGGARACDLAALPDPLARRAVRCWLGPPPPALDEVDAVLAVARGERRAVDLAGGRRVHRSAGVLHARSTRLA